MLLEHLEVTVPELMDDPFFWQVPREGAAGKRVPALVYATMADASNLTVRFEPAIQCRRAPRLSGIWITKQESNRLIFNGEIVQTCDLNLFGQHIANIRQNLS